jgi:hypothetical protein
MTKVGLYAIDKSTTLESNKSRFGNGDRRGGQRSGCFALPSHTLGRDGDAERQRLLVMTVVMVIEEVTAGECPPSFPKPVLPRPSTPGNPQRHSSQRCDQQRVLPLLGTTI